VTFEKTTRRLRQSHDAISGMNADRA
jgi:hypothetical protein